jgi:hypothetical protein
VEIMDIGECQFKRQELRTIREQTSLYLSGEKIVPRDTRSGDLRRLYNQARNLEHCAENINEPIDVNIIFNLLFYEGVKSNFVSMYQEDLEEVEKYLKLNLSSLEKNFQDYVNQTNNEIKTIEDEVSLMRTSSDEYLKKEEAELKTLKDQLDEILTRKGYRELRSLINFEEGIIVPTSKPTENQLDKLKQVVVKLSAFKEKKQVIEQEKQSLKVTESQKIQSIEVKRKDLANKLTEFNFLKNDIQKNRFSIWVPNAQNLKNFSRQELMKNLNNMQRILSLPVLDQTQTKAIQWLEKQTSSRLQHFENPFSWHEAPNGEVEEPDNYQTLSRALSR